MVGFLLGDLFLGLVNMLLLVMLGVEILFGENVGIVEVILIIDDVIFGEVVIIVIEKLLKVCLMILIKFFVLDFMVEFLDIEESIIL